jgi:RNA polymerase sigma-70 factor, ECF subfamily
MLRAKGLVSSAEDAEDIVSSAVVQAFRTKSPWRGESRFSTWFMTVVINEARMAIRRAKIKALDHTVSSAVECFVSDEAGYEGIIFELPDRTAESRIENCVMARHVRAAVAGLSLINRECIEDFHFLGKTAPQIATARHLSLYTVKTRLYRARVALRIALKAYAPAA